MGGKRPDQYRIAPGEGTRTDYKWTDDAADVNLKEGKSSRRKARTHSSQPIAPDVPNPAAEAARADEMQRQKHIHEEE